MYSAIAGTCKSGPWHPWLDPEREREREAMHTQTRNQQLSDSDQDQEQSRWGGGEGPKRGHRRHDHHRLVLLLLHFLLVTCFPLSLVACSVSLSLSLCVYSLGVPRQSHHSDTILASSLFQSEQARKRAEKQKIESKPGKKEKGNFAIRRVGPDRNRRLVLQSNKKKHK